MRQGYRAAVLRRRAESASRATAGGDFTIVNMVAPLVETYDVRPKHVRLAGIAHVLSAMMAFGFLHEQLTSARGYFLSGLVALVPSTSIVGLWWWLDAGALAAGRRRFQRPILLALLAFALALAFYVSHLLQSGQLRM